MLAVILLLGCSQSESATAVPNPTTAAPRVSDSATDTDVWKPAPRRSRQWQLNDLPIDSSFDVAMYDIDLFDNDAATVSALHEDGRIVICYMNAGGWEGERWLAIRRLDVLAPIMEGPMIACKNKGFDGIEPDNVDGYLNDTGFDLTATDQLEFNSWGRRRFSSCGGGNGGWRVCGPPTIRARHGRFSARNHK